MNSSINKKQALKAFLNGTISPKQLERRLTGKLLEVYVWLPEAPGVIRCQQTGEACDRHQYEQLYEQDSSDQDPDMKVIHFIPTDFLD